jgi:hypothetical protein
LNTELLEIFKLIEPHYNSLIEAESTEETAFECIIRSAFAKNFEFNYLCNSLEKKVDTFFLMPALRSICEDLIAIKYIKRHINIDRNKLITLLTKKRTYQGTVVQKEFLEEHKPHQITLEFQDTETEINRFSQEIKDILIKNGLKGDKELPSVAHMATDSKLIKLYNYLYYATSETVHFEPALLLRLGWTENLPSNIFKFSTRNFHKYHHNFCTYYSALLFIEFYKAFKKDIGLDVLIKKEIKGITDILNDTLRAPEIVTFEESNVKPPSPFHLLIRQMAYNLAKQEKRRKGRKSSK